VSRGGHRALSVVAALAGAALFAYAVERAGTSEIIEAIRRVGWGLVLILALAGIRFLIRAQCWRWCLPPGTLFPFPRALAAFLAGDAVGNVTPLGLFASEPTKVLLTRHHLATREAVASLAIENIVYAASVMAIVGLGLVIVAMAVPMPRAWFLLIVAALAAMAVVAAVALYAMKGRWDLGRLWRVFALDLVFHALAVLEVYVTLQWLLVDRRATLIEAIAFEALNRVITAAFKFVPFRVGIDEASAGALAPLLSVNPAAGVALAVVRKVRNLFWAAIGLALVAAHPTD
jgi:hypothetical protein